MHAGSRTAGIAPRSHERPPSVELYVSSSFDAPNRICGRAGSTANDASLCAPSSGRVTLTLTPPSARSFLIVRTAKW
jgi:hypothetical protein